MTRAQCIIHRDRQILMVKHSLDNEEWWCLPGGGVEPHETSAEAVLRELEEECCVQGKIIRQTSHYIDGIGNDTDTFLVEIGDQVPQIGNDPELEREHQILVDLRWLTLAEIPERDRAYLWAAGLLNIPTFLDEVSNWGDVLSYPTE
ncbi:MAG: NUDIX hydrolase [Anaerolineales bacterium]